MCQLYLKARPFWMQETLCFNLKTAQLCSTVITKSCGSNCPLRMLWSGVVAANSSNPDVKIFGFGTNKRNEENSPDTSTKGEALHLHWWHFWEILFEQKTCLLFDSSGFTNCRILLVAFAQLQVQFLKDSLVSWFEIVSCTG